MDKERKEIQEIYGKYVIEIMMMEKNVLNIYPCYIRFWLNTQGAADELLYICPNCKAFIEPNNLDKKLCPTCGIASAPYYDGRLLDDNLENIAKKIAAEIRSLSNNCSLVLFRYKIKPEPGFLNKLNTDEFLSKREYAVYTKERLNKDLKNGKDIVSAVLGFIKS
jgi:RNA polymerase subunit RPABC4/transcription elongation factor Spt4